MPATLEHLAHAPDNDYTVLEVVYRAATGGELVSEPFGAVRCGPAPPARGSARRAKPLEVVAGLPVSPLGCAQNRRCA